MLPTHLLQELDADVVEPKDQIQVSSAARFLTAVCLSSFARGELPMDKLTDRLYEIQPGGQGVAPIRRIPEGFPKKKNTWLV